MFVGSVVADHHQLGGQLTSDPAEDGLVEVAHTVEIGRHLGARGVEGDGADFARDKFKGSCNLGGQLFAFLVIGQNTVEQKSKQKHARGHKSGKQGIDADHFQA
ncbi:MAG: hypothetical protein ACK56F_10630 [bacterium]